MLYHAKPQKRSKIALLLGVITLGVGGWVAAYLAYFHTEVPVETAEAVISDAPTMPPARYEGESFSGHYLAGRFAESQKQMEHAAAYMTRAIQMDGKNLVLLQETLRSMVAAGRMDDANTIAKRMLKQQSVDPLATLVRISYMAKQGEFANAQKLIDKPAPNGIYAVIKPAIEGWLQMGKNPDKEKPVDLQDAIDKSGFLASFMHYQAALMDDMAGRRDEATKHYAQALSNPEMMPYRVVQAVSNFYLREGKPKKAQKIYDDYAKQNPASELIPDHLPQGDLPPEKVVPLVATPTDGLAEILFTTASLLFGEQVTTDSMIYLKLALYLRPDFPPAQLMMANLYEQMENHQAAIDTYQAIDPDTVFYKRGRLRTALNYQALGNQQKAIGLLRQLEAENKTDSEPLMILGDLFRNQQDFKQAAYYYSEAIKRIPSPAEEHWSVYYSRGICYERSGQWDKAEADFAKALELSPDQPDVLNYLGYSWLVKNQNLIKATHYIERALEQRPSDAHIIDSMAWAYFLMGNFKESLLYMEQAAEISPQDATINEHLGDVYWRLGRRIEAKFQWQRALDFKPEDPEAIKKKIKSGLPDFVPPTKQALGKGAKTLSQSQKSDTPSQTQ